jgi:hypothetical protein
MNEFRGLPAHDEKLEKEQIMNKLLSPQVGVRAQSNDPDVFKKTFFEKKGDVEKGLSSLLGQVTLMLKESKVEKCFYIVFHFLTDSTAQTAHKRGVPLRNISTFVPVEKVEMMDLGADLPEDTQMVTYTT